MCEGTSMVMNRATQKHVFCFETYIDSYATDASSDVGTCFVMSGRVFSFSFAPNGPGARRRATFPSTLDSIFSIAGQDGGSWASLKFPGPKVL